MQSAESDSFGVLDKHYVPRQFQGSKAYSCLGSRKFPLLEVHAALSTFLLLEDMAGYGVWSVAMTTI